jgi:hypothetical protein
MVHAHISSHLIDVLHADGPDPERSPRLQLYAWLVGDWDIEVLAHSPDGASYQARGEIHAGWILQGRGIQDVWTIPRTGANPFPVAGNWFGTTLRIYDPGIDAWRISWIDPATNSFRQQLGRARGDDIIQEGKTDAGAFSRWSFTEIEPASFRWLAETSPDAETWTLVVEVLARRVRSVDRQ